MEIANNTKSVHIILFSIVPFVFDVQHDVTGVLNPEIIIPLLAFALLTVVLAQFLWYKTLELIPATVASNLGLLGPFFGVILAVLILNERLYFYHLAGGLFVIFGLVLTIMHHQKHTHHHLVQKTKHWFH